MSDVAVLVCAVLAIFCAGASVGYLVRLVQELDRVAVERRKV